MVDRLKRQYSGPIASDFGGTSRLVNGQWVRGPFLSEKERIMLRTFGKLFKKNKAKDKLNDTQKINS